MAAAAVADAPADGAVSSGTLLKSAYELAREERIRQCVHFTRSLPEPAMLTAPLRPPAGTRRSCGRSG